MRIDEIKEYYSESWENPKEIRNVIFDSLNELVKERLPPGDGKKALDIGSGHGRIVSYLVERGYDVTAMDFNEDFCEELKIKFPNVQMLQEDVEIEYKEERPGDFEGKKVSAEKAKRELDWEPKVDFEKGVRKYIEWSKENIKKV